MSPRIDFAALRERAKELLHKLLFPAAAADPEAKAEAEFMPGRIGALLQNPPRPAFLIIRGTAALFIIAIIWATFSHLEEVTVGEGKVIPSSQVQVIQNLEGGIVAKIPVNVGDVVRKGQVVLNIDETRFSSSLGESRAKYLALKAKTLRLAAEVDGKPYEVPPELEKENPLVFKEERALYNSRKAENEATINVLKRQVDQRQQELNEKRAKAAQLAESYKFVQQEVALTRPMAAQKVISDVELLRLERQATDIRGELDATRLAVPRLEASLQEGRDKVEGAQAKFKSDAAAELSAARAELEGTSATNVAAADRLERTTVRSPVDGIVKTLKITTLGGVIQPGSEVMEIVPIEDNLLIEAKVRPSDVAFLHPGQPALVKITAYDYSIYGGLDATLENITVDSITNDKGESFYLVRVRTKTNRFGSVDKPMPIMPGMTATVHIQTGRKSVLNYLLKPIIKAKSEALRER